MKSATTETTRWRVQSSPQVWRRAVEAGMTFNSWRALGDWLEEIVAWDYSATLTFRRRMSRGRALELAKGWLSGLARETVGAHILVLFGVEAHALGGHHVHLVVHVEHSSESVDELVLAETWLRTSPHAGPRSAFTFFEPGRGGAFYLIKDGDWDFFVACPRGRACRKNRGCRGEKTFKRIILRG